MDICYLFYTIFVIVTVLKGKLRFYSFNDIGLSPLGITGGRSAIRLAINFGA